MLATGRAAISAQAVLGFSENCRCVNCHCPAGKRGAVALGELCALDVALAPERRALAEALRAVFTALGMSVCDFAAVCHRDKGAISRYLSGKRVPPS